MKKVILFVATAFLIMLTFGASPVQSQTLESVFLNAAASGQLDFVKSLLDNRANIESKNNQGAAALILAYVKGHELVVELLLDRGVTGTQRASDKYPDAICRTCNNAKFLSVLCDLRGELFRESVMGETASLFLTKLLDNRPTYRVSNGGIR